MTGSWLIVFHIMTLESLVNFGSYQWHGIIFFGRIWSNAGGILKICHEDRILNSWSVFLGSVSLLIFFFFNSFVAVLLSYKSLWVSIFSPFAVLCNLNLIKMWSNFRDTISYNYFKRSLAETSAQRLFITYVGEA